jgi:hypothetical protein
MKKILTPRRKVAKSFLDEEQTSRFFILCVINYPLRQANSSALVSPALAGSLFLTLAPLRLGVKIL